MALNLDTTKELVIPTNLSGKIAKNILLNVIGQLSDGIWENSRAMEHYWPFADIESDDSDNVYIVIHKPGNDCSYFHPNTSWTNYFVCSNRLASDPQKIKEWFADKIRKIVNEERKDYEWAKDCKFKADNSKELNYMSSYDKEDNYRPMTVSEAYSVYKALKG